MSIDSRCRPVHLVGSIPLRSVTEVFEEVSSCLGSRVRRIPDGEVGPRSAWIGWQQQVMDRVSGIEPAGYRHIPGGIRYLQYKMKQGVTLDQIDFRPIGYAAAAKSSYAEFEKLLAKGAIPVGTRFQVSLPTPLAVVVAFFAPESIRAAWGVYESQLLEEVRDILSSIPHHHLAFQWDVAVEITEILERPDVAEQWSMDELIESIERLCEFIPSDVEVGVHLCYGDPGHKHIVEPKDMGLMVTLANQLTIRINRLVTWFHMPVPRNRSDESYFEPLRNLRLKAETELFIGLIHLTDGLEGARLRLATAKRVLSKFGVATECGFGRRPPDTIAALLDLHRQVSELD
jgi:hypothetical protein